MDKLSKLTIGELLKKTALKYPDFKAVKYIETNYERSYYDFNQDVDSIARGLLGMGFKKGDHVAVWAPNYPEWIILFYATARIGMVLVTVNTGYKAKELSYLLEQSDSRALFMCSGLKKIDSIKIINSICPELKNSKPCKLSTKNFPLLKSIISFDHCYDGMLHWSQIHSYGVSISDEEYANAIKQVSCDDVCCLLYTSGTTGYPKGVMLTHSNLVNNAIGLQDRLKLRQQERVLCVLPFFHIFGLTVTLLLTLCHVGRVVPLINYNPIKAMHTIEYEKINIIYAVPTMYLGIIQSLDFDKYKLSTLRLGIVGGALCPPKLYDDIVEKLKLKHFFNAFGQTESSPACIINSIEDTVERKKNSIGYAMPLVEVKIVNAENNETMPPNTHGEICVKGHNVMKGYYKMPDATLEAIDRDGWLHTGDMGMMDENGYIVITGRIKDLIIRGGENIFPKELEDFIFTHPAVKDVYVVSVPSERYGEEVFAYVIPQKGTDITDKDIIKYVEQNMASYKVPRYVAFIDNVPMTSSGKVQKFKLREMAKEYLAIHIK